MEEEFENDGTNAVDDMMVDYDYHINTGELPELFDESSVDDFIAKLNDWDKNNYHFIRISFQKCGLVY